MHPTSRRRRVKAIAYKGRKLQPGRKDAFPLSFTITPDLYAAVTAATARLNRNRSEILRESVALYLSTLNLVLGEPPTKLE